MKIISEKVALCLISEHTHNTMKTMSKQRESMPKKLPNKQTSRKEEEEQCQNLINDFVENCLPMNV